MRGRRAWGLAPFAALAACADIWGFHDLTPPPDAAAFVVPDATTSIDVNPPTQDAPGAADTSPAEDSANDDSGDEASAVDAPWDAIADGTPGDADEASAPEGGPPEAGPPEASPSDGAADAIAECQSICAGCCDTSGHCELGTSPTVCGVSGALCQSCAGQSCIITSSPCCKSNGSCGCSGLLGCN
jgi:hypothetical protein